MHLLSPVDFPGAIEPPFGHREDRKKRVKRHAPCACGGESESRRSRGGIGLGSAGPALRSAHRATPSQQGHSEAATLRPLVRCPDRAATAGRDKERRVWKEGVRTV